MSESPETDPWVVVAAGGSLETAFLPARLFDLRADYHVRLSAALSPRALDFVTELSVEAVTAATVYTRSAQLHEHRPLHLHVAQAERLVLWPATPRILAQCATGEITDPVTRLFAFTEKARVIVAPCLHPSLDLRIYRPHVERLRELGCTVVGPEDLFASFADAKRALVDGLGLRRRADAPGVVRLERL